MSSLPRLLVVGDVPVEATFHGSMLLYRLLEKYPKDRLHIVSGSHISSQLDRRLPGVNYSTVPVSGTRWMNTRFHHWVASWLTIDCACSTRKIARVVRGFNPEAVLTIPHGFLWHGGLKFAMKNKLPLHLIVHDDWVQLTPVVQPMRRWVESQFATAVRYSRSRFAVSLPMACSFKSRYGLDWLVQHPYRSQDSVSFANPPDISLDTRPFTCAFAGSINTKGYEKALRLLSDLLAEIAGKLLLYSPLNSQQAQQLGFNARSVVVRAPLKPNELVEACRREAHFLFAPMSFDSEDANNMSAGFPSKLTDYTAMALPILVFAPPYSSISQWAHANAHACELVETFSAEQLRKSLLKLRDDAAYRKCLACTAADLGEKLFGFDNAWNQFAGEIAQ